LGYDIEPARFGGQHESMLKRVNRGAMNGPGMDRGCPRGAIRRDLVFTISLVFSRIGDRRIAVWFS
jgi:hypothetical protein